MTKQIKRSNYRVVIGIAKPWAVRDNEFAHKHWTEAARALSDSVRRHCDGVDWIGVEHDEQAVCSHCGLEWEEYTAEDERGDPENVAGMPCCCEKAIAEWEARVKGC